MNSAVPRSCIALALCHGKVPSCRDYFTLVGPVSNVNERCSFLSVALKYNTIVKCKNERGFFAREGPARVSFLNAEASLKISKFPKGG